MTVTQRLMFWALMRGWAEQDWRRMIERFGKEKRDDGTAQQADA